ncbi:MAG: zinc dependent phospholipase C family protein [Vicingaceae bacterium]
MNKIIPSGVALLTILLLCSSWGFYGHKKINRMAVFTLPPEMIGFYKSNIVFISAHAVDPDKRRYASKAEAPRHYIDIDHYAKSGEDAFKLMPTYWSDAVEKYTEDTLQAYGIVPWHISAMSNWLTKAFEEQDANKILSLSADLGHYIADAHVPLHTTENYNGQLTGQKGIHGLWESRIPELTAENFDFLVGRASYIDKPIEAAWQAVKESHSYLDSVLIIERELTKQFPSDQKYAFEQRGQSTMRQYSQQFALSYAERMDGMVEKRMQQAILMVGSLWYTAWVNAGQPDLSRLGERIRPEVLVGEEKELEEAFKKENIKGRGHEE